MWERLSNAVSVVECYSNNTTEYTTTVVAFDVERMSKRLSVSDEMQLHRVDNYYCRHRVVTDLCH